MANVLIRDVPERVVKSLKERAAQQHRSLQQELRLILEEAAGMAAQKTLRAGRRIRGKTEGVSPLRFVLLPRPS